jgi:DNA-binding GntR family transcriptional regulator
VLLEISEIRPLMEADKGGNDKLAPFLHCLYRWEHALIIVLCINSYWQRLLAVHLDIMHIIDIDIVNRSRSQQKQEEHHARQILQDC